MAVGGSWFARVFQYVANELLVDRLANNPSFQRFAVRTSKAMQELSEKGVQKRAELMEELSQFYDQMRREASQTGRRV